MIDLVPTDADANVEATSEAACRMMNWRRGGHVKALLLFLIAIVPGLEVTNPQAQTLPYMTNVRAQAPGTLRGTLVNPLGVALSAWMIDVVDESGRRLVTQTSDALLVPDKFIPPRGTLDVEIMTGQATAKTFVCRAAVTADGMEVGNLEDAFQIIDSRLKRATALQTTVDFLHTLDPSRKRSTKTVLTRSAGTADRRGAQTVA